MQTIYGSINWHKIKKYKTTIPGSEIKRLTFPKLWKDNGRRIIL